MNSAIILVIAVGVGILAGYLLPNETRILRVGAGLQEILLYLLMLMMGMRLGSDPNLLSYLGLFGFQALVFAIFSILGSVCLIALYDKIILRRRKNRAQWIEGAGKTSPSSYSPLKTTVLLFAFIAMGVCLTFFFSQVGFVRTLSLRYNEKIVYVLLILMVFVSGVGIGQHKSILHGIRQSGFGLFVVPALSLVGTLLASIAAGKILGFDVLESMGISAACGWYTMAGVVMSDVSTAIGLVAFLTNLLREILAVVFTPMIARCFGANAAVAPGGATTMDVTLPVILQSTSVDSAALCFSNGLILTIIVPAVLRFFVNRLI